MPIVAGAILPHSPLLVPNVAQDHFVLLEKTVAATRAIVQNIYAAQPEVMLIITPHADTDAGVMSVQTAEQYRGNFLAFGDPHTKVEARGALGFIHQLRQSAEEHHVPVSLRSPLSLDYGSSVPLLYIHEAWSTCPVVPFGLPAGPAELCIRGGAWLYDFCQSHAQRIALIGSLDGSRRRQGTEVVRRPTTEERAWSSAITAVDPSRLPNSDHQSNSCADPVLRTLLTTLQPVARQAEITSFAAPFGVGLLTAWFTIST